MDGKVCVKCEQWKSFVEFNKQTKMKDGHQSYCRECWKQYAKQYRRENNEQIKQYRQKTSELSKQYHEQYRQENAEKLKEQKKQYYKENAESIKQKARKYRKENIESVREKQREYYKKNSEAINQRVKKWVEENRDARRKIAHRGNLKRRSYQHNVTFTRSERKQILERYKWTCQSCGCKVHDRHTCNWNTPDKAHIDHIIPLSKGGDSSPTNIQVLCRTCNLSKQNKNPFSTLDKEVVQ